MPLWNASKALMTLGISVLCVWVSFEVDTWNVREVLLPLTVAVRLNGCVLPLRWLQSSVASISISTSEGSPRQYKVAWTKLSAVIKRCGCEVWNVFTATKKTIFERLSLYLPSSVSILRTVAVTLSIQSFGKKCKRQSSSGTPTRNKAPPPPATSQKRSNTPLLPQALCSGLHVTLNWVKSFTCHCLLSCQSYLYGVNRAEVASVQW